MLKTQICVTRPQRVKQEEAPERQVSKYNDKMFISNYMILKSVMSLFKCAARTGLKGMQAVSVMSRLPAPAAVLGSNYSSNTIGKSSHPMNILCSLINLSTQTKLNHLSV